MRNRTRRTAHTPPTFTKSRNLAEKCGMAQPNIARIENGTYATSIDVLSRIAEALGKRIELV